MLLKFSCYYIVAVFIFCVMPSSSLLTEASDKCSIGPGYTPMPITNIHITASTTFSDPAISVKVEVKVFNSPCITFLYMRSI